MCEQISWDFVDPNGQSQSGVAGNGSCSSAIPLASFYYDDDSAPPPTRSPTPNPAASNPTPAPQSSSGDGSCFTLNLFNRDSGGDGKCIP